MTHENLSSLQGRVVVITGGCGQIGYATAQRLSAQGARIVVLVRRDLESAQTMMRQLSCPELEHFAVLASVTDTPSLKAAAEQVRQRAGHCDILINSAGILNPIPPSDLSALTDEIFDEIVTVNLRGVYATIREFVDLLRVSGHGVIINISSQSAQRASNSCVAYAAAKAGVDLMTRTLAKSLAPEIRVLGIAPGYLEHATSGVTRIIHNQDLIANTPLKTLATGNDIAKTIEALVTLVTHATGTTLLVDGGRLL